MILLLEEKRNPILNFSYCLLAFWGHRRPAVRDTHHSSHSSQGNWIVPHAKMPQCAICDLFLSVQQLDASVANCCGLIGDRPLIYLPWETCWFSGQSISRLGLKYHQYIRAAVHSTVLMTLFLHGICFHFAIIYANFRWDLDISLRLNFFFYFF